jgi:hypothetical protein
MHEEIQRNLEQQFKLFSKPLDVEKYLEAGVISRLTQRSKTKFIVNGNMTELPEEIIARVQELETKMQKDGSSKMIVTLNLKVLKR